MVDQRGAARRGGRRDDRDPRPSGPRGAPAKAAPGDLRRSGERPALRVPHQQLRARRAHHRRSLPGALDQERWQIELFFKWLKQNLRLKSFLGTTLNAVLTQVWIALCTYLLLAYLKFINGLPQSLQQILRLLQVNLFQRRNLLALLHGEARDPPPKWQQSQLVLI